MWWRSQPPPPRSGGMAMGAVSLCICPECGQRQFTHDESDPGFLVCLCGLKLPLPELPPPPPAPPPAHPPPPLAAAEPPAGSPVEPPADGSTPQRAAQPQKKKPAASTIKAKIPKWLPEVAKRLRGVPRFVVKESIRLYSKVSKDTKRQGCTEWGLALAHYHGTSPVLAIEIRA